MKNIYLIIPTLDIGGAEKRFLSFWLYAQRNNEFQINLVITEKLYQRILQIEELASVKDFLPLIKFLEWEGATYFDLRKCLKTFSKSIKDNKNIFHYIMSYPIYRHDTQIKTVFSFTESSFNNLNWQSKILNWLCFWSATYVDILDPKIAKIVKKYSIFKRDYITQTSNSFVDLNKYSSVNIKEKKNWLVFLGRFVGLKQVIPLVKALPAIDTKLKELKIEDAKYFLLGHGKLQEQLENIISGPAYKNIDVEIKFAANPTEILQYSKVIFSLQKNTNYPSKSLLEGLACQNIPVVTDIGTTRLIAPPEFSFYVPEEFSSKQIADRVFNVFKLPEQAFEQKSKHARQLVKEKFTIEKMANYYLNIYKRLLS